MRTANLDRRRWSSGGLGAVLLAAGLIAASWLAQVTAGAHPGEVMPPPVALDAEAAQSAGFTHEMIDAMHGEETADRLHDMEGVNEMMAQCAANMESMGAMMGRR